MDLIAELRRRNVFRVAGLYLVAAWLIVQVSSTVLPMFDAPSWVPRTVVIVIAIGFLPALLFSWLFELTPQGFKRDAEVPPEQSIGRQTARRMDRLIVGGLLAVIVLMLAERVWFAEHRTAAPTSAPAAAAPAHREAPQNSVAVLAFADLSQEQNQAYFSDGMAEEILNALARIKSLKVVGRSSSFQFRSKDVSAERIGSELGVAHILEGSVRKQGDLLRITAKLIEAASGLQQWSKAYDGKLADVFDLQESCARDIATELNAVLGRDDGKRLVEKVTDNPQAYALFVEAQTLVNARVGDSLPRAIAKLEEVTRLDPGFARAWSKQAVAYAVLAQYTVSDWRTNWRKSDEAAEHAIRIDPDDAEAYAALSYNQFSQRHYSEMVEPMRRALELGPDNAAVNYWATNELAAMGRTVDADARLDAMLAHDPANHLGLFYKSMMRWRQGDATTAIALGRRLQALGSPFGEFTLSFYSAKSGDCDTGAGYFAGSVGALGSAISPGELQTIYQGMCKGGASRALAIRVLTKNAADQWAPAMWMQLGESQRALDTFEHGDTGLSDGYLNWMWQPEDWSRALRHSPGFQGFAKRIGMLDYWRRNAWPDLCKPAPASGADAFTCE